MGISMKESVGEGVPVLTSKIGTCSSTPLISSAISMINVEQVLCVFQTGDMAAETIDFKVQTVDSDGTSNAADLKAATQLAAHASNNDSKVVVIAVRTDELAASGKKHIRMYGVTGNTTGGTCCYTAVAVGARYSPGSDFDSSAVVQIKT
jgi:hypothetical protein